MQLCVFYNSLSRKKKPWVPIEIADSFQRKKR